MRLFFFIFCLSLVNVVSLKAQNSFKGFVRDSVNGKPLSDATILVSDLNLGTRSDETGYFFISPLPAGSHLIEISHIGYETVVMLMDFLKDTLFTFNLNSTVLENKTVVVTGIVRSANVRNVPLKVTVLKATELDKLAPGNLAELLSSVPGISNLSTGNGIGKPIIRGLGNSRILVVEDGVRQEGQQWGDEHGMEIDDAAIQRIEILKGPSSLVYGSDALAGVINILTDIQVPEGAWRGAVATGFAQNDRLRKISGRIATQQKGMTLQLSASARAANDYENAIDGFVLNSRYRQTTVGAIAGLRKKWGYTRVGGSIYHLKAGIIEGRRDSLGKFVFEDDSGTLHTINSRENTSLSRTPYQDVDHIKVFSDNLFQLNKKQLYLNVSYQQNHRKEFGHFLSEGPELDFRLNTLGWTSRIFAISKPRWELTLGITGMYQANKNHRIQYIIPDYLLTEGGIFAYLQRKWNSVQLAGGIRADGRKMVVSSMKQEDNSIRSGFSKSLQNVSGSLGAAWVPNDQLNVKANFSRAYRAPSMAEMASYGAHEGTLRFEYGNEKLNNEINWQADFSLDWSSDHLSFSLAGFSNYFSNYIFYQRLSNISGTDSVLVHHGDTITAFAFNQNKAQMNGFEVAVDIHPHPWDWLHFKTACSFVRGRFLKALDGSHNLPLIPAPRILSELRGEMKEAGKWKNLYVRAEADLNFKQNRPFTGYNTETITAGYTLFNIYFGGEWYYQKNKKIIVYFSLMNVFNKVYQSHLSRLKYTDENVQTGRWGVFNMGRSASLQIQIPFQLASPSKNFR